MEGYPDRRGVTDLPANRCPRLRVEIDGPRPGRFIEKFAAQFGERPVRAAPPEIEIPQGMIVSASHVLSREPHRTALTQEF